MRLIENLKEMTETARGWLAGGTVGFVPIKGEMHGGHLALIEEAHKTCEIAVVGLLGSCLPVATDEERIQYKRNLEQSLHVLRTYQNLVVFIPRFEEIYSNSFTTHVTLTGFPMMQLDETERADAHSLMTLIVKMFHLVRPDVVYIGQKDVLQTALIFQVIRDLNIDIRLHIMPTVRENDGLALSSHNYMLSQAERQAAPLIYQALQVGKALITQGERNSFVIEQGMVCVLQESPLISLRFVGVYSSKTFLPVPHVVPGLTLSFIVFVGTVRLTDTITWLENGLWRM